MKTCKKGHQYGEDRLRCPECHRLATSKYYHGKGKEKSKLSSSLWAKANPERVKFNRKAFHNANPEKAKDYFLRHNYGLTLETYNQKVIKQNNLCAICGHLEKAIDPKSNKTKNLSVDHNHETGKVRDLLCDDCNRGLGLFKEKIENFEQVILYLKRHKIEGSQK